MCVCCSEQEILREEISSLKAVKDKLSGRVRELEEEVRRTRDDLEKKASQQQEGETEVRHTGVVDTTEHSAGCRGLVL